MKFYIWNRFQTFPKTIAYIGLLIGILTISVSCEKKQSDGKGYLFNYTMNSPKKNDHFI